MATSHLWGDLPEVVDIRTPKMVLAEQASALQEITKGALTCELVADAGQGQRFIRNSMRIVAPSLGRYSVELVQVSHPVIVYPCIIESHFLEKPGEKCEDEAELEKALVTILQDPKTHKLITNLLQQIKAENRIAA